MTLDELLLEWSYRSEKGYPSMDNPSDVSVLKEILNEIGLPTDEILDNIENNKEKKTYANKDGKVGKTTGLEDSDFEDVAVDDEEDDDKIDVSQDQEEEETTDKEFIPGDEEYDAVIRTHLGLSDEQPIPKVKGKYPWPGKGGATFNIQVKESDLKHWQDFWELSPPKVGEEIGTTSKGTGNGEVSLYWLYQHSNTANVIGTQGSDNPDLEFNGVGVEVKAFGAKTSHASAKGLGRWSSDKPQLDALGILFGFQKLVTTLEPKASGKLPRDISPNNFHAHQLIPAFEQLNKLLKIDLEMLGEEYSLFLDIAKRLDNLKSSIGEWDIEDPEDGARKMVVYFMSPKVGRKPGDGGFLTNVKKDGSCRFWGFDTNKLLNHPDLLKRLPQGGGLVGSTNSQMYVSFDKLLG